MIGNAVGFVLQSLRTQKLSQDIAYSTGSFVILAISGIVINIVVIASRDAAALGIFNIAYAVYIIASQLAVWGFHYSVLRHSAYYAGDSEVRGNMLFTAILCSIFMGVIAASLVFYGQPVFGSVFDSVPTGIAIRNAAIGLVLFPLNKVLIAYLNGLRHMKAYAVLQAIRYLSVMFLVTAFVLTDLPIETATYCFIVAESITSILAAIYIWRLRLAGPMRVSFVWVWRHFKFGTKGLPAGMFAEVNSRADVLLIGALLGERETGIYSFAAMLADGLYHVLAMVRINFNPLLVAAVRDKEWGVARSLRVNSFKYVLPVTVLLSMLLIVAYYVFSDWIMGPEKELIEGLPSLIILLIALTMICVFVPFDNLLMVSGYPGFQTAQQLVLVGSNIIVALALLPILGIEGAAIGTGISYLAGITMMILFARKLLGWNVLTNTVH